MGTRNRMIVLALLCGTSVASALAASAPPPVTLSSCKVCRAVIINGQPQQTCPSGFHTGGNYCLISDDICIPQGECSRA